MPSWESVDSLLDDSSQVVRKTLLQMFKQSPAEARSYLQVRLEDDGHPMIQNAAQRWMRELGFLDYNARFRSFIESYAYELETGSILLCQTHYPDASATTVCQFLDKLAHRYHELAVSPLSLRQSCQVLNRIFFHEYGFRGDSEDFYNPENSFIHRVIERRKGIPISLSILYLLVGQRVGLELEPVGAPGRFLVGAYGEGDVFFIDPFERGAFRSRDLLIEELLLPQGVEDERALNPCPIGEVLCRCCRNLVQQFELAGDKASMKLYKGFVSTFEAAYARADDV